MRSGILIVAVTALYTAIPTSGLASWPYEGGTFKGRIAYSADGNHNDPDDWAASPVALAILAECGNAYHPGRTTNLNPQMKPWYELGAALITPAGW